MVVLYLPLLRKAVMTKRDVKICIVAFSGSCLTWQRFHSLESALGGWTGVE
jgi:hypothetical protein